MGSSCSGEEKDLLLSDKPLYPETPPKRVQLEPKLTYSRRRFREKKFTCIPLSFGFSPRNDGSELLEGGVKPPPPASTVGPEATTPDVGADAAEGPKLVGPTTLPVRQDNNEETTRNNENKLGSETLVDTGNFPYTSTPLKMDTKLNKRKKDGSIIPRERATKKPKKKIHRPKVIGESKRKRPKEPSTLKRAYTRRKNLPEKIKDEFSVPISVPESENVVVERVIDAVVSCRRSLNFDEIENKALVEAQSNAAQPDEKNVPIVDRHCDLLIDESIGFPREFRKKRVMRFKVQARDLMLDLKPWVKTKGNRLKRSGPGKKLPKVGCNEKEATACEVEVEREKNPKEIEALRSEVPQVLCNEKEALVCEVEFEREDILAQNENLRSDYKSIEFSRDTVRICGAVKPFLIDLNLPFVENERRLVEQSSGPQCYAIVSHSGLAETAQNADLPIVPAVEQGQGKKGQISLVKKNRKQLMLKHYEEEIKAWKVEVKSLGYGNTDEEEAKEKLESEREIFRGRIQVFTSCMHRILGDRTFTKWKGSVIDSVIGVFLTQNVSDILSSSAFIDLRAKFPIKRRTKRRFIGQKLLLSKESEGQDATDIEDFVPNGKGCSTFEDNLEDIVKLITTNLKLEHPSETKETVGSEDKKKNEKEKEVEVEVDWEEVRKRYHRDGERREEQEDSVDWEAVRLAPASEIADAIKKRGQHNNIAKRIKEFLDRVVELHKVLDLEWLRDVPADQVQKYLLEFNGLGLKSVECIRLLAIENVAFPVDTNVGRIAVRLGWVPLEPLPEELQIHLLQQYPIMDSIQKYLWPQLCTLDQRQLYELHYHLITFGKVFCTKRNPSCNDCPMKAECKHYASHYASARKALPGPPRKGESSSPPEVVIHPLPILNTTKFLESSQWQTNTCEPIIEMPQSPEPERERSIKRDFIEDYFFEDDSEIVPTMRLNEEHEVSQAMVTLAPEVASYPLPKLKSVSRLRTKHLVYELPDSHPLLAGLDERDSDDPSPYLLAIWTSDESRSPEMSDKPCCSHDCGKCGSCIREQNPYTVRGTILIPCRTAMRGSFPLNGTYFQVNEVFADHESSHNPIEVSTELLWSLRRRFTYFGTSTSAIFKGLPSEEITINFWTGFMCDRAYDRKTCTTKPLVLRLHRSTTQQAENRKKTETQ